MKNVLLIVVLLIGVLVIGVAVFLATFDADRYRPLVVKQLESALGKPVRLERLSLGWRDGLAVLPDVQYVASRIVATKAQELLGGLLERALERGTDARVD